VRPLFKATSWFQGEWPSNNPMSLLTRDIEFFYQQHGAGRPLNLPLRLWSIAGSSGLKLLCSHRLDHWLLGKRQAPDGVKWLWLPLVIVSGLIKLVIKLYSKSEIGNDCEIEGGVIFSDQGNIIFGARKVGSGSVIGTRVTVGMSHADKGRPEIGRNVWIGSDCVVYGTVSIGDGATLLPGTVLTKTIPPGVVMQGNPARLLVRNFDNTELRLQADIDAVSLVNQQRSS